MQSDHGQDQPSAEENDGDEQVWLDLVARLQEPEEEFPLEAKTVSDFDPLGVWRLQATSAPAEPELAAMEPSGPRDYEVSEAEEGFVPEEPPSLRNAEPVMVASWIGAAGGPLFLVIASIFWRNIPILLVIAVILAFLAGTGYLLSRLPKHRDHDSGDGAVV